MMSLLSWCQRSDNKDKVLTRLRRVRTDPHDTDRTSSPASRAPVISKMSDSVKQTSAFTPVIKSTRTFKHPFSINSLLNLDDLESERGSNGSEREIVLGPYVPFSYEDEGELVPTRERMENTLACDVNGNEAMPAWIYATRYSRQGIPSGAFVNARKPRKPLKKHKQRPLFGQKQIERLEEEFSTEKYISKSRRSALADEINLTDAQVRTWFQNRRTRWRKETQLAEYRGEKGRGEPQPWMQTASTPSLYETLSCDDGYKDDEGKEEYT